MEEISALRAWLTGIYEENDGCLTPELVREAARPEDSVGNPYLFNVEVAEAAEEFYLSRAHDLIRRVKVTVVSQSDGQPRRVRFFHALPGEETSYVYEPLTAIQASPSKLEAARKEAVRRLRDAERSVEDLDAIASTSSSAQAVKAVKRARKLIAA